MQRNVIPHGRLSCLALWVILISLASGCSVFGGRRVPGLVPPSAAGTTSAELLDQQGLVNAVADVTAEISAIRAERDSFAGLTYQSTLPAGLAMLLAWQSWLSHKREMSRLTKGGLR